MRSILSTKPSIFKTATVSTPLGPMVAIANEEALYLLEFIDSRGLALEIARLKQRIHTTIISGETAPISTIKTELKAYFKGNLREFLTPLFLLGTPFQKRVWEALRAIPFGETKSYKEQAQIIENPCAYRAVANANGANQLAIVIPCHRIITNHGELGGYAGGIAKKKWLLDHEVKSSVILA